VLHIYIYIYIYDISRLRVNNSSDEVKKAALCDNSDIFPCLKSDCLLRYSQGFVPGPKTKTLLVTSYDIIKGDGNFTLFVPRIVVQLLQLQQTKCTILLI